MKTFNRILFALLLLTTFSSAYAQKYWAAAYIDLDTGIAGAAYNANSQNEAERAALQSCQKKHGKRKSDCRKAGSFYNGCAAVYWGTNAIAGFGSHGYQLVDAKARAINNCRKGGGENCKLVMDFCTTLIFQH